jgi:hypothetical protein
MTIIQLILLLVVIGVIMYLVNTFIPMADKIKQLLNVVVVIVALVLVIAFFLHMFGIHEGPYINVL